MLSSLSLLLLTAFAFGAQIEAEPFEFKIEPAMLANVTTGEPFPLKMGIITPEYLRDPHWSFLGQTFYKMYPYELTLTLENVPGSGAKISRHLFLADSIWPLSVYRFDAKVQFVLPSMVPAGEYRIVGNFKNTRRPKRIYPPSYSPHFQITNGPNKKYDSVFKKVAEEGKYDPNLVSILEAPKSKLEPALYLQFQAVDHKGKVAKGDIGYKADFIN